MQPHDLKHLGDLLDGIWGLKGAPPPTAIQKAMFFRTLKAYPIHEVEAGLDAHLADKARGRFLPMPADVIAAIEGIVADDGRPGVEEAWAVAFRTTDETATVVWTTEMAEAFGTARPLLMEGDEVGARMAFKESYARLLEAARHHRVPPQWSATLGTDLAARTVALVAAVQAGRLSGEWVVKVGHIANAAWDAESQTLRIEAAPASLERVLALPAPEGESETTRKLRLKAREAYLLMSAEMAAREGAPSLDAQEKQRTRALATEAASKVANHIEGKHP